MAIVETLRVPFRNWHTWVRITRPEQPVTGALPLFVLHGGPGMAHNYIRNLEELSAAGRVAIHYDQLGCGNSTHLPEAPEDFWTPELFVEEFENLVSFLEIGEYHVLGQSWGGMLAAEIAVRQPGGLRSIAICNSPASMRLWSSAAQRLRAGLPAGVASALDRHEAAGTLTDPEYLAASDVFYSRHVCRTAQTPPDFAESVAQMEAEPTVYHTMNGPNEFYVVGTLQDWTIEDRLQQIAVPALVAAGEFDEAAPETWAPYAERIPDVLVHVFSGGSHCVHLEQPEEFREVISSFLARHEATSLPAESTMP